MLKLYKINETTEIVFSYKKTYPTYSKLIIYNRPYIKTIAGFEPHEQEESLSKNSGNTDPLRKEDNQFLSFQRTKRVITDLTICNDFDSFATFTFKDNRNNLEACRMKMSSWLHSQQKTYGKFNYLIVPEFHKDKKAIHFHALLKDYKGKLYKTNHKIKGRTVYNITSYRKGYTTLVKIDDIDKVSSYIRKYITKDMPLIASRKRYWRSTNLIKPIIEENVNEDLERYEEIYKNSNYTIYKADN